MVWSYVTHMQDRSPEIDCICKRRKSITSTSRLTCTYTLGCTMSRDKPKWRDSQYDPPVPPPKRASGRGGRLPNAAKSLVHDGTRERLFWFVAHLWRRSANPHPAAAP